MTSESHFYPPPLIMFGQILGYPYPPPIADVICTCPLSENWVTFEEKLRFVVIGEVLFFAIMKPVLLDLNS